MPHLPPGTRPKSGSVNQEQQCKSMVFARAVGRCERCGAGFQLSYHHRKKRSQGGEWDCSNIVLLCGHGTAGCHGFVEHNPNKAEAEGWHVRPWDDPEEVPIKLNRSAWFYLLPDGDVSEANQDDAREVATESWVLSDDAPTTGGHGGDDNLEDDRINPSKVPTQRQAE